MIVMSIAFAPFGETFASSRAVTAMGSMVAMTMSGDAEATDVDCCPKEQSAPMDCGKTACPSMVSCTQQCLPAAPVLSASNDARRPSGSRRTPMDRVILASLLAEPPARPPRF